VKKISLTIVFILIMTMMLSACASYDFDEQGGYIITAKDALAAENAIIVDVRSSDDYASGHVAGSINLPMSAFVVDEPYSNMLADETQVSAVMSEAGITENDMVYLYDDAANMQAARVEWTLNMYSNENVKVISGGYQALVDAEAEMTTDVPELTPAEYDTGDRQRKLIVTLDYVNKIINEPEENTVIIDTRSASEFAEGTIPGSVHIEYLWNNYANGEYKSPRDIRLTYLNKGINPDTKIILFCKTSVRATQTYAALKDAGFKDVRVYDGAWLEYEAVENPVAPTQETAPVQGDAS